MRRTSLLILCFSLTGCLHTEITQQTVSTSNGPYRKLIACSLADNPQNAAEMEALLQKRLRKHHVDVQPCEKVFASTTSFTSDTIAARLAEDGFDGVLVFQPDESSAEPVSPSPSMNETEFSTLEHFWTAREGQLTAAAAKPPTAPAGMYQIEPYGKTRMISGVIKLLSVKEDRIAWATGGVVEGSADTPTKEFIRSVVERTEDEMTDAGMIPEK